MAGKINLSDTTKERLRNFKDHNKRYLKYFEDNKKLSNNYDKAVIYLLNEVA